MISDQTSLSIQKLAVLGATGSIGDSTLDLVRAYPDRYQIHALSGFGRVDKLLLLCQEFLPKRVCTAPQNHQYLQEKLDQLGLDIQVLSGEAGLVELAEDDAVDTVVAAIVGAAGLPSTIAAAKSGKKILLANKESLVMAGGLVMRLAKKHSAKILPIDSEHNAIFQCLPKQVQEDIQNIHQSSHGIKRLWLTASGGGFLYQSLEQMSKASVSEAVKHPNWSMGQKISIDSATMMNKGLELIEACHLFDLPPESISVVIHPNSVVHSLVEYSDGSFLAQLGSPDMKTPISYALAYPDRLDLAGVPNLTGSLDLYQLADLKFLPPDLEKFACLRLAMKAARQGAGACITLNAANEVAVNAFLAQQIRLTDIAAVVEDCLEDPKITDYFGQDFVADDALPRILAMDSLVRQVAQEKLSKLRDA